MFTYKDDKDQEVIVYYGSQRKAKRNHFIRKRVRKFCFCCGNVSWHSGLRWIAWMTICFGIAECVVFGVMTMLPGEPSAINICLLFPVFCTTVVSELIIFVGLGLILWVGVTIGKIKFIQTFPWGMLAGYVLALAYLILVIIQGELICKALVWAEHGITTKSEPEREKNFFLRQQIIFYTVVAILILAIVFYTTYAIILSLTWIDKLETEAEY